MNLLTDKIDRYIANLIIEEIREYEISVRYLLPSNEINKKKLCKYCLFCEYEYTYTVLNKEYHISLMKDAAEYRARMKE